LDPENSNPPDSERAARFVEALTGAQRKLYAYICTLMFGDAAAADVLQETNLALWARASDFDFDRPFLPWAMGFARNRILSYRRTQSRTRLVFSNDLFELVDKDCAKIVAATDNRMIALQRCLGKLNPRHAQLIRDRYITKATVKELAARLGTTAVNVASELFRVRKRLALCIERRLALEE
jgi:RNA polymerase sigma-70 factor, ECF subfamily